MLFDKLSAGDEARKNIYCRRFFTPLDISDLEVSVSNEMAVKELCAKGSFFSKNKLISILGHVDIIFQLINADLLEFTGKGFKLTQKAWDVYCQS